MSGSAGLKLEWKKVRAQKGKGSRFPPDKDGPEMEMGLVCVKSLSWARGPRAIPRPGALRRGGRL